MRCGITDTAWTRTLDGDRAYRCTIGTATAQDAFRTFAVGFKQDKRPCEHRVRVRMVQASGEASHSWLGT
jgi:hypothetical protein